MNAYVEKGNFARARAALERKQKFTDELDQPTLNWFTTWNIAAWELMRGDLAVGERLAERAFQLGQEAGQADAVLIYGGQLSFARHFQGRGEEIIEMLEQSVSAYPAIPAFRAGFAALLCWLDRRGEATAILEQAASDGFEHVTPGSAKLIALALYANVVPGAVTRWNPPDLQPSWPHLPESD